MPGIHEHESRKQAYAVFMDSGLPRFARAPE
jgi:hypothetical protein